MKITGKPNLQVYRLELTFSNTSPSNNTTIKTLKHRHLVSLAFHTHLRREKEDIRRFNLQRVKIDSITMNNRRWFLLLLYSSTTLQQGNSKGHTFQSIVRLSKYEVED